jgi:hypothetical protein
VDEPPPKANSREQPVERDRTEAVFERYTIVLGPRDLDRLDDLVSMVGFHRWPDLPRPSINRSTIIRALVRIAEDVYQGSPFPVNGSPWAIHLHEQLPVKLRIVREEGARRGPKPGSKRKPKEKPSGEP